MLRDRVAVSEKLLDSDGNIQRLVAKAFEDRGRRGVLEELFVQLHTLWAAEGFPAGEVRVAFSGYFTTVGTLPTMPHETHTS
jgi:hypothetical protein